MQIAIALERHQAGFYSEAEDLYREILASDPECADAWHLLGVLLHQTGRNEQAAVSIQTAIEIRPGSALYHTNLGAVERELGCSDAAVSHFRQALALNSRSIEAHYNLALALLDQGQLGLAGDHYRAVLQIHPAHPQTLNNLGNRLRDEGAIEVAIEHFRAAIHAFPTFEEAHRNLGDALYGLGRLDEAASSYQTAATLAPERAETHYNIGNIYHRQRKSREAVASYAKALNLQPIYPEAYNNLGVVLREEGYWDDAIVSYRRSLKQRPSQTHVSKNLSAVLRQKGDSAAARVALEEALRFDPEDEECRHLLRALAGECPDVPAPEYITQHFDRLAPQFDQHLVENLEYCIPALLRKAVEPFVAPAAGQLQLLDIGCGTGLAGLAFQDLAEHLAGVDLSPRMVEVARSRGVYDDLQIDDMLAALAGRTSSIDIVIAADVFAYVGKLDSVLSACHTALRPTGRLCFSTEAADSGDFRLNPNGRYAHHPDYVASRALQIGYEIEYRAEAVGRKELGAPVPCQLYILRKVA